MLSSASPSSNGSIFGSTGDWPVGTFIVKVNGDASPNQFTIRIVSPGGGTATPESFSDDGTGTPVTLSGGGTFEMVPNSEPGYTRSLGNDCVDAFSSPSLPQRFECTITFTQIGLVEEEPASSAPAPATSKEMPLAEQMPQMSTPPPPTSPTSPASMSENLPPSPQQKPETGVCDNNGNGLLDADEIGCLVQLCATATGKLILADSSICDTLPSSTDSTATTTTTTQPPPPAPTDGGASPPLSPAPIIQEESGEDTSNTGTNGDTSSSSNEPSFSTDECKKRGIVAVDGGFFKAELQECIDVLGNDGVGAYVGGYITACLDKGDPIDLCMATIEYFTANVMM